MRNLISVTKMIWRGTAALEWMVREGNFELISEC